MFHDHIHVDVARLGIAATLLDLIFFRAVDDGYVFAQKADFRRPVETIER